MIKNILIKFKLWWQLRKTSKELDEELRPTYTILPAVNIQQDSVQAAYEEGLKQIKKKINNSNNKIETVLSTIDDILKYAENEDQTRTEFTKRLKEIYVYKEEKELKEIIDKRITDYYKLQRYNEERTLIKSIKKARKDGNEKLATSLEEQWSTKYRNNSRT